MLNARTKLRAFLFLLGTGNLYSALALLPLLKNNNNECAVWPLF